MEYKLKKWREKLVLSQQDVAELAGCTRVTVSDLERETRTSQPQTIHAIAAALALSLDELRAGPTEENVRARALRLSGEMFRKSTGTTGRRRR